MRTGSGKYRLDAASGSFFGTGTMSLIARRTTIIGRFARTGTIRGSLTGRVADATWHDANREGWMKLTFAPDYASCTCEYGMRGGPAIGTATLDKVSRMRNSLANHPSL